MASAPFLTYLPPSGSRSPASPRSQQLEEAGDSRPACPRRAFHPGRAAIPEERPSPRSGACDRDGDELRNVIRLQPHQHSALAILMGVADGITHVRWGRNFL